MRERARLAFLLGFVTVMAAMPARAAAVSLEPVTSASSAIYMTSPPGDPRLFVVERAGRIQVLHDGMKTLFLDINTMVDSTNGERGLSSMAFDPNYPSNGLFYIFFTDNGTAGGAAGDIHIDEYQVSADPNVADPASRRTVWTFPHSATMHNGGQLQFGKDGLLYISVGDNVTGANAQSLTNPYGKILRIDPHGTTDGEHGVPATNPFVGTSGAVEEIWGLGLRNPFRFSFDHATGDLVIGDVGQSSREEIDFSPASSGGGRGANFGWPCREGFIAGPGGCSGSFTDPVSDYPHTDPGGDVANGCAIIGGFVYRGAQIPELEGRYVYTDFCNGEIRSQQLGLPVATDDRNEGPTVTTARSFGEDANCELYVTSGSTVYKLVGSLSGSATPACQPVPGAAAAPAPAPQTLGTSRSCRRLGKGKGKAAAAKKRKKLCVRATWAPPG